VTRLPETVPADNGLELRADCSRCLGLCCVAQVFATSADFAFDKPAGVACRHLDPDTRCGIHDRLRQAGMRGCVAYDCFGAGQHVTQVTLARVDWRESPGTAERMFGAFTVMRQLHELAWHLTEALALETTRPAHAELRAALDEIEALTGEPAEALLTADVAGRREAVAALLGKASELARADVEGGPRRRERDRRGADLAGADLRGADIRGADLRGALFVTRSQLEAATGDTATLLPSQFAPPAPW
jgi:uncharacterized protein YjbI with pentapeptide repeats